MPGRWNQVTVGRWMFQLWNWKKNDFPIAYAKEPIVLIGIPMLPWCFVVLHLPRNLQVKHVAAWRAVWFIDDSLKKPDLTPSWLNTWLWIIWQTFCIHNVYNEKGFPSDPHQQITKLNACRRSGHSRSEKRPLRSLPYVNPFSHTDAQTW